MSSITQRICQSLYQGLFRRNGTDRITGSGIPDTLTHRITPFNMTQISGQNRNVFPTLKPPTSITHRQSGSNPEETLKTIIESIVPELGTGPIESYVNTFFTQKFSRQQQNQLMDMLSQIKEGIGNPADTQKKELVKQVITDNVCYAGQFNALSQLLSSSQMALTTECPFEKSLNESIIWTVDKIAYNILSKINDDIFKGFPDLQSAHQLEPIKYWLDKNFGLYNGEYPKDVYNQNTTYTDSLIAQAFEKITQSTPFDLDFWAKSISDIFAQKPQDYPGFPEYFHTLYGGLETNDSQPESSNSQINILKGVLDAMSQNEPNTNITMNGTNYLPTQALLKILLQSKLQGKEDSPQRSNPSDFSEDLGRFCLRNGIKGAVVDAIQKDNESILSTLKSIPDNWTETETLLLLHVISKKEVLLDSIDDKSVILGKFPVDPTHQVTLAHLAAEQGLDGCLSVLHALGMDLDSRNSTGVTPLLLAAGNGHVEVVRLLLGKNAKPNIQDEDGASPLLLAARKGHVEVVRLLLGKNAEPNVQEEYGLSPLLLGACGGHVEVVRLLLGKDANPNIQDRWGSAPLHFFASKGDLNGVKLLLGKNANPNIQDEDGISPLHLAAQNGHTQVVELLLEHEAEKDIKNNQGFTPLSLAAQKGHTQVVELLQRACRGG